MIGQIWDVHAQKNTCTTRTKWRTGQVYRAGTPWGSQFCSVMVAASLFVTKDQAQSDMKPIAVKTTVCSQTNSLVDLLKEKIAVRWISVYTLGVFGGGESP